MQQLLFILIALVLSSTSFGQKELVPKPYVSIEEVVGDLDKDGIGEKVVVYNVSEGDERDGVDRELIIFKKIRGKWKIWHRSKTAVGNSTDGGMMGDPFEYVEIRNGILLIHQSGGSSWKWFHVDKYRYQNKQFELIGYTSSAGKPCEYWQDFDFNLITGKIEVNKNYEECEDGEEQEVYKTEHEKFNLKLSKKITLSDRRKEEIKIVTPKYKLELYL